MTSDWLLPDRDLTDDDDYFLMPLTSEEEDREDEARRLVAQAPAASRASYDEPPLHCEKDRSSGSLLLGMSKCVLLALVCLVNFG